MNPPIFLIPFGRTGGTLFVTMLDVHPDIAMSYEIFQDRLIAADGQPLGIDRAGEMIAAARNDDCAKWVKSIAEPNLKTFVARARRAGVEVDELLSELTGYRNHGGSFADLDGRLDYIDRLMQYKMRKIGKSWWGGKQNNVDPRHLHRRHPDARFFAMVRDGRDVLASQLTVGNFQTNAAQCAAQWREAILNFRRFIETPGVHGRFIRYESLIEQPEKIMAEVTQFIGVPFARQMLQFDRQDLPLLKNPHGHLSHKQIAKGLNGSSIGRWKRDLSQEDAAAFERTNFDLLADFDYVSKSGT